VSAVPEARFQISRFAPAHLERCPDIPQATHFVVGGQTLQDLALMLIAI